MAVKDYAEACSSSWRLCIGHARDSSFLPLTALIWQVVMIGQSLRLPLSFAWQYLAGHCYKSKNHGGSALDPDLRDADVEHCTASLIARSSHEKRTSAPLLSFPASPTSSKFSEKKKPGFKKHVFPLLTHKCWWVSVPLLREGRCVWGEHRAFKA